MRQTLGMISRFAFPARGWILGALGVGLALGGCDKNTRDTDIKFVRVSEVRTLVDKRDRGDAEAVLLVDPRSERAFAEGHIPGARNLRLPQVDAKKDADPQIEKYNRIIVYGDDPSSASARGMTKRLLAVGYKGVRLYPGGLKEWLSRGYDAETLPVAKKNEPAEGAPAPDRRADPPKGAKIEAGDGG
jgi:3-mercaptopyruvate sulfurtransferase SseA